ncbi:hypothetical protein TRIP_B50231 [uncultured Desulfatiglans sp.]|uniref:Uncharacterized protein n=1 Tax=Uncultured Desulfatiglans sp. TaxID=1748965 RepID=A0A653AGZ3_UNCDX|nr:hypothetical protein TRIP_B50231 [uncultured Desulfatiglans sp.]
MVFLANFGVNLHVCLCGDLQVASAQTFDFLDIGQKSSLPDWKPSSIRKWSFWPISASICTFACAATCRSPPHKRLISLVLTKPGPAAKRWD